MSVDKLEQKKHKIVLEENDDELKHVMVEVKVEEEKKEPEQALDALNE